MITIKAPIELKVRSDFTHGYDAFGERITGNYSLMGLEIGEEELLHMVSSPPEIYLMDGESTTIGGSTFISSRKEEKYNIVNNMLNRILLSVDGELTYQDRTYITDALYKLGVRDDRRFMTEVKRMIRASHLEEDFLNHYFEIVLEGENRELRERTLELSKELVRREGYHTERSREDFLSESILHRLQTGAIYQIVSNFNRSLSDTRIELQESMLSEQENVARKLLVQNFLSNIVQSEPEVFREMEGRAGTAALPVEEIRSASAEYPEQPGQFVREERSERFEQAEREFRETERLETERETAQYTERETAEIVYREGEAGSAEPAETQGTTEERVIIERTRVEGPESVEYRRSEQILTEREGTAPPVRGEAPAEASAAEGAAAPGQTREERLTERSTEEYSRLTERVERDSSTVSTSQALTERELERLTERERAELIFREGESREELEETILDRLTEQTSLDRERLTERELTESRTRERAGTVPGQELRTDRVTSETLQQHETERVIPGETASERVTEYVTDEGERITQRTDTEYRSDHTDRYVTEAGEILRTEHEGADLIYREGIPATETEGGEAEKPGTIRETDILERERIREAGEPVVSPQTVPGAPGERVTEVRSSTAELTESERRILERRLAEARQSMSIERERVEEIREPGGAETPEEAALRERLTQQILSERLTEQRRETETAIRETENYVTETGEILRMEHEGAELIYREGIPATETEGGEAGKPETIRETDILERERIREAGEPVVSRQTVPGAPGERVTEVRSSIVELTESERRTLERRLAEARQSMRIERERIEEIRETGGAETPQEAALRERLTQQILSERLTEQQRRETETATRETENYVTETGEILRTEHEGAELIYREGIPATETEGEEAEAPGTIRETRESQRERVTERERLEQDRDHYFTAEETVSAVRSEVREQLEKERISRQTKETKESDVRTQLREQLRTEQIRREAAGIGEATDRGRIYERSELVYRETEKAGEETAARPEGRRVREVERYRSDNIYERELLETERSREKVTAGLTAAVLLDVVKTLYHAGYERIAKGDTWIEYRGALYHSAENIFNRLNYNLEAGSELQLSSYLDESQNVDLAEMDFTELQEITENAGDVQTIENTIREMNEMNLRNVERYEQMVQVLKQLRPERKREGGIERTRQEALSLLDDEQALYESLQHTEDAQEEERREIFHEITRIFPEQSVEIFKVVEQYLDGSGQAARVGITRNNVEAAAEEIRRITTAVPAMPEPVPEPIQTESSELVYRRNDRVTQEELQEMVESLRRTENRQRREIEQKQEQLETERRNTYSVTTNTARTLSRQEAEDIEALVSRGVRSQMSAISEQVLQKLEKKLRNEKIRRGI